MTGIWAYLGKPQAFWQNPLAMRRGHVARTQQIVQFCKLCHRHLLVLLEAQMEQLIACVDELATRHAEWLRLRDFLPASTKRLKTAR